MQPYAAQSHRPLPFVAFLSHTIFSGSIQMCAVAGDFQIHLGTSEVVCEWRWPKATFRLVTWPMRESKNHRMLLTTLQYSTHTTHTHTTSSPILHLQRSHCWIVSLDAVVDYIRLLFKCLVAYPHTHSYSVPFRYTQLIVDGCVIWALKYEWIHTLKAFLWLSNNLLIIYSTCFPISATDIRIEGDLEYPATHQDITKVYQHYTHNIPFTFRKSPASIIST